MPTLRATTDWAPSPIHGLWMKRALGMNHGPRTYRRVQVKIRFRNQRGQTAKDSSPEKGTTPARGGGGGGRRVSAPGGRADTPSA